MYKWYIMISIHSHIFIPSNWSMPPTIIHCALIKAIEAIFYNHAIPSPITWSNYPSSMPSQIISHLTLSTLAPPSTHMVIVIIARSLVTFCRDFRMEIVLPYPSLLRRFGIVPFLSTTLRNGYIIVSMIALWSLVISLGALTTVYQEYLRYGILLCIPSYEGNSLVFVSYVWGFAVLNSFDFYYLNRAVRG